MMLWFKKSKKIIGLVGFLLLLGIFLPKAVLAESFVSELQEQGLNMSRWVAGNKEIVGDEAGARGVMDAVIEGLTVKLVGAYDEQGQPISTGAFGTVMAMVNFLYTSKPVSTQRYIAYVSEKLEIIKPAYAQGKGWQAMEPVLSIWKAMRNVCYIFFVIAFIAVGFMIMFRRKIDPQTVVTVQAALPKIIIALILVTFSYAIVGLLIDIGEIVTGLIVSVLKSENLVEAVGIDNLLEMLRDKEAVKNAMGSGVSDPEAHAANIFTVMRQLLQSVGPILKSIETILSAIPYVGGVKVIGAPIVALILGITIISAVIKTFFMLLSAYVTIVISTIFSPFAFFMNAIPGGRGAGQWLKNLLANIIIFPATFLLLLFAAILAKPPADFAPPLEGVVGPAAPTEGFGWSPAPFGLYWEKTGYNTYNIAPLFINNLLALGIILIIPRVGEVIKSFMEGKPAEGVGESIQGGLAGAAKKIPFVGGLIG